MREILMDVQTFKDLMENILMDAHCPLPNTVLP